jgi:hypothetical protein
MCAFFVIFSAFLLPEKCKMCFFQGDPKSAAHRPRPCTLPPSARNTTHAHTHAKSV